MSRPRILHGTTIKVKTGCGNLFVTVNFDKDKPYEVFARLGKSGSCFLSQIQSLTTIISIAIQGGIPIEKIIEKLKGHRCSNPIIVEGEEILSCSDALAKAMEIILKDKEVKQDEEKQKEK
jgi:ribonucleoside-diphosphate reductase alpha chain